MTSIVIFSFNRAMELDTLVQSIIKYWETSDLRIFVIYNTTDEPYEKGYQLLQERIKGKIDILFLKESQSKSKYRFLDLFSLFNLKHYVKYPYIRKPKTNFRELLIECIDECSEQVMFLTDDSVFINNVTIPENLLFKVNQNPYQNSISLRLGLKMNNPPKNILINDKVINWEYYKQEINNNWGYPFSVDGHIYSKKIILELFKKIIFSNPSSLEMFCCEYVRLRKWLKNGITFIDPKLISFPLNMVQNIQNNKSSAVSPEILNSMYLEGKMLIYQIPENINTFQQYPEYFYYSDGIQLEKYTI